MRDEHADACECPRCQPPRLWTTLGDQRQPLATAIGKQLPAVLARDLRDVFTPIHDHAPALESELARIDRAFDR